MTKKVIRWGFMLVVAVFFAALVCAGAASAIPVEPVYKDTVTVIYANGDWTYDDTYTVHDAYLIENESNWQYVVDSVNGGSSTYQNAKLILANDIVFTNEVASLGNSEANVFTGTIYGNGHKFVNFTQGGEDAHGLIYYVGDGCLLNYVQMTDSNITSGTDDVGGLVGSAISGGTLRLDGCSVTWSNITTTDYNCVGGLVGAASGSASMWINASWVGCVSISSGIGAVGGLVGGASSASHIADSWVNGSEMYAGSGNVGGLVGFVGKPGIASMTNVTVRGCKIWASGNGVGGLVGGTHRALDIGGCVVEQCTIEGNNSVGGLVGGPLSKSNVNLIEPSSWVNKSWVNATSTVGSLVGKNVPDDLDNGGHSDVYSSSTAPDGLNGFDHNDSTYGQAYNNGSVSPIDDGTITPGCPSNLYSVSVAYTGEGTASASPIMNTAGVAVTLSAYPKSGYMFDGWSSSDVSITGNTFTMPDKSVKVTAKFVKEAENGTHFAGEYAYVFEDLGPEATNVNAYYDEIRKTIFVEKANPSEAAALGNIVLNVTQFGLSNADVQLIEVDYDVSLASAPDAFSKFTNAGFNYLGSSLPADYMVGGVPVYTINATHSEVYIDALGKYTGEAVTVDTNYAVPGQGVRIAVKPLQNYSVYGWTVIMSGNSQDDSGATISKSLDPNDGATTYILTMPASDVTVIPKLRDSGSTFVTYTFLDADTYIMEIPADFSLTGIDKTVEGKEVNITACDLLEGHNLKVTMASANGYDGSGFFRLLSVKDRSAQATYAIGEKDIYLGSSAVEPVQEENKVVLDTSQIAGSSLPGSTAIDDLVAEGNLKTELQFTLKQMLKPDVIGKYKDKLTFTVEITTA